MAYKAKNTNYFTLKDFYTDTVANPSGNYHDKKSLDIIIELDQVTVKKDNDLIGINLNVKPKDSELDYSSFYIDLNKELMKLEESQTFTIITSTDIVFSLIDEFITDGAIFDFNEEFNNYSITITQSNGVEYFISLGTYTQRKTNEEKGIFKIYKLKDAFATTSEVKDNPLDSLI